MSIGSVTIFSMMSAHLVSTRRSTVEKGLMSVQNMEYSLCKVIHLKYRTIGGEGAGGEMTQTMYAHVNK
jgi:hypothetical protein